MSIVSESQIVALVRPDPNPTPTRSYDPTILLFHSDGKSATSGIAGGLKYVNRSKRLKNHVPPQRWRLFA